MTDKALVPGLADEPLRDALIRAVGFDRLSEPQRELALAIAARYGLDPMLKHLVMVEGRPYITRDGLLHVAHKSNDFDGIEVTDPVLDAEPDPKGKRYYRVRCSVWRKSFSRPFVYPGRYPFDGANQKYSEEMAIKVGEVMCLRRAFDVAAPVMEERWDGDFEEPEPEPAPASLAERVARRVEQIAPPEETAPEPEGSTESPEPVAADSPAADEPERVSPPIVVTTSTGTPAVVRPTVPAAIVPELDRMGADPAVDEIADGEPLFVAPAGGIQTLPLAMDLEEFSRWCAAGNHSMALVKEVAAETYPGIKKFGSLTPQQLGELAREIVRWEDEIAAGAPETAEAEDVDLDIAPGPVVPASPTVPEPEGSTETPASPVADSPAAPAVAEPSGTVPDPFHTPEFCGAISPLSGATCTLDAGHTSKTHRAGLKEAW